jgi:hypothetical protein
MTNQTIGMKFSDYLGLNQTIQDEEITHTRIGNKEKSIRSGKYNISDENWNDFMQRYYQSVFVNGEKEYLTEKQIVESGPIMIDIDLRYEVNIQKRQHTASHILDAVMLYAENIDELVEIENGKSFEVFVMEKDDVNVQEDLTKDGIHIIIGIKMHKAAQMILRNKVMKHLKNLWDDLPITNTWDDVLDKAVTKGQVNWTVYGSRKPNNQAYLMKYHYVLNKTDGNWEIEEKPLESFCTKTYFNKLSARYTGYEGYEIKKEYQKEYDEYVKNKESKVITPADSGYSTPTPIENITDTKLEGAELKRYLTHVKNIKSFFAENYSDWFNLGNAFKGTFGEEIWFILFKEFSLTSTRSEDKNPDYDEWEVYFKKEPKCGKSTILKYSKKSNLKEFNRIEKEFHLPKEIQEEGLKSLMQSVSKKEQKELEKEQKVLKKQQEERAKLDKRDELIKDKSNLVAQNDKEACDIIYEKIKDNIKFSVKILYYKNSYRWIDDAKVIEALLRNYVMNSGIKKLDDNNKLCDYVENRRCATDIAKTVIDKAIANADDEWTSKMFTSSLGKILFSNGYYDFKNSLFYYHTNELYDNSIIFVEHIAYPFIPCIDEHYCRYVKNKIFITPFDFEVADYYILNLARGLAGDAMKRVLFGIGDGNTGKSGITVAIKSVCGGYFGSFNGNNITVKKNPNPDDAQALRWLMLLAHKRIIASNEIGQDPVNGEMLKKMSSGGKDDIVARGHQGNETPYKISFLPIIFANDISKITPMDDAVVNRVRAIPYTKKYVEVVKGIDEIAIDPNYDEEVETPEFRSAFMHLLIKAYDNEMKRKEKCALNQEPYMEYEPSEIKHSIKSTFGEILDSVDRFKEEFEITNDKEDYVTNDEIQEWLLKKKIGISLTKLTRDLNKYLKYTPNTSNVENKPKKEEGKTIRGWYGIKN